MTLEEVSSTRQSVCDSNLVFIHENSQSSISDEALSNQCASRLLSSASTCTTTPRSSSIYVNQPEPRDMTRDSATSQRNEPADLERIRPTGMENDNCFSVDNGRENESCSFPCKTLILTHNSISLDRPQLCHSSPHSRCSEHEGRVDFESLDSKTLNERHPCVLGNVSADKQHILHQGNSNSHSSAPISIHDVESSYLTPNSCQGLFHPASAEETSAQSQSDLISVDQPDSCALPLQHPLNQGDYTENFTSSGSRAMKGYKTTSEDAGKLNQVVCHKETDNETSDRTRIVMDSLSSAKLSSSTPCPSFRSGFLPSCILQQGAASSADSNASAGICQTGTLPRQPADLLQDVGTHPDKFTICIQPSDAYNNSLAILPVPIAFINTNRPHYFEETPTSGSVNLHQMSSNNGPNEHANQKYGPEGEATGITCIHGSDTVNLQQAPDVRIRFSDTGLPSQIVRNLTLSTQLPTTSTMHHDPASSNGRKSSIFRETPRQLASKTKCEDSRMSSSIGSGKSCEYNEHSLNDVSEADRQATYKETSDTRHISVVARHSSQSSDLTASSGQHLDTVSIADGLSTQIPPHSTSVTHFWVPMRWSNSLI